MANKLITQEGKQKLLKLGFLPNNADPNNFQYIALGGANSNAAKGGSFQEIDGNNYQRVSVMEESVESQSITISAIFDDQNYNSSQGTEIREIAIVDNDTKTNDIFFAYAEVPPITKTGNISLKYTIIISIE